MIGNNFAVLLTRGADRDDLQLAGVGARDGRSRSASTTTHRAWRVMIMAGVFVLVNLAVDLTYGLIDPRVRAA